MSSLKEIVDQLKETNQSAGDTNRLLRDWINTQNRKKLDDEEARRELTSRAKVVSGGAKVPDKAAGGDGDLLKGLGLGALLTSPIAYFKSLLLPLTAGLTAFAAASLGLRGWELGAIKKLKDIVKTSIPNSVFNGVIKLRNAAYGIFGLTPEGILSRDALGRFQRTPPITEQIRMRMNALRLRTLRVFGIGADGKLITTPAWQKFLSQQNLVGRVAIQVRSLFNPFVKAGSALGKVFTGKVWQGISGLFSGAGGFLKIVGTILKPLGFFFSAWKGVSAFLGGEDEDGIIKNLGLGIGTFIGNFFGAPLDLLKKGVRWVIAKAFGIELKEGEEYDPKTASLPEKIIGFLDALSFEKIIKSLVQLPFNFLSGAIDWIGNFFDDPIATLDESWQKIKGGVSSVAGYLFSWVEDVWSWIKSFLPDVGLIARNFANALYNLLPEWAQSAIDAMGPSDKFKDTPIYDQEKMLTNPRRGYESGQDYFTSGAYKVLEGVPNKNAIKFEMDPAVKAYQEHLALQAAAASAIIEASTTLETSSIQISEAAKNIAVGSGRPKGQSSGNTIGSSVHPREKAMQKLQAAASTQ